jgi:hypothetical protein
MKKLPTIQIDTDFRTLFPSVYDVSITKEEWIKRLNTSTVGKQVRIIGKYVQVDVRPRPIPPNIYRGHSAIVLENGGGILLYPYWHSLAIRPSEEIAKFENKRVIVIGKFVPEAPQPAYGHSSIFGPCMLTIDSIQLAD